MKSFRSLYLALPLLSTLACSSEPKAPAEAVETTAAAPAVRELPSTIPEAIDSSFRNPENKQRDAFRHPAETLQFFGLQPNMKVIEILPGQGWYTEILSPLLSKNGEYIAAVTDPGSSEYMQKAVATYKDWFVKNPEVKGTIIPFVWGAPLPVAEPVDMIVTFRNVHNWMGQNKTQEIFNSFFKALKPGGVLGVVEHRGNPKVKQDPKGKSGYVNESEVIKWATKAGFKLAEKSEINANPKDTKDYKDGVWTLPPSLKKGDVDRDKYVAIGESDRMTLRFVKPEPAAKKAPKAKK
ncbi:MAG: methyltransferase [Proteobacteria bacterium]|nr:MAG: methyltransferase [Pseudomonadota bacterium]